MSLLSKKVEDLFVDSVSPKVSVAEKIYLSFGVLSIVWHVLFAFGLSFHHFAVVVPFVFIGCFIWLLGGFFKLERGCEDSGNGLFFFSFIFILIYFIINRPDGDDATYLQVGLSFLDSPHEKLCDNSFFEAYGLGIRILSASDALKAVPSYLFNIPFLMSYYVLFPVVLLFFYPYLLRELYRIICNKNKYSMTLALLFVLYFLIFWADAHRTPSNFAIVRIFQGKAVYSMIITLVQIIVFNRFVEDCSWRNALISVIAIASGVCFSMNALFLSAYMYGAIVVLPLLLKFDYKNIVYVLPVMIYFLFIVYLIFVKVYNIGNCDEFLCKDFSVGNVPSMNENEIYSAQVFHVDKKALRSRSNLDVIKYAFGDTYKTSFMLVTCFCSIFFVEKKSIKRLMFLCFLLLGVPHFLGFIGVLFDTTLSWRWLWTIPFIPVTSWMLSFLLTDLYRREKGLYALFLVFILLIVFTPGRNIFSRTNGLQGTQIGFSFIKLKEDTPIPPSGFFTPKLNGWRILYREKWY